MIRTSRVGLVHGGFLLFAVLLVGRAAKVQLLDGGKWRARAAKQQFVDSPLPAPRGRILDASGDVLVESRQLVRFKVSPKEVWGDTKKSMKGGPQRLAVLARTLARVGVSSEFVHRATDTTRTSVEVPGRFLASDVDSILTMRGIHAEPAIERVPPSADGLRRLIGHADENGEPVDGLEKSLDAMLRGVKGHVTELRDARGRKFDSPTVEGTAARPGHTVRLTINQQLQDIADRALADAVTSQGASGGDIVVMDPLTGEVRAMASKRADPLSTIATGLTEPYEPGSTLKPFVAARLLDLKRARVDEVMNVYGGKWEYQGRKIEDDHPAASFTLFDVIRFSSNIGIVQFAQRLAPGEQYELLRDLGFGTQTGLPYPGESQGVLRAPKQWDKQTPASLAMGYALNVTPVQLAAAYSAIANGGELLEPALVQEVRSAEGTVRYHHERRVVRRVMSVEAAAQVRAMLRGVVEGGTGEFAKLSTYEMAGKTGTAKRTLRGKYVKGAYTASFVGLFPADKPQIVILVKLDNPTKTIYGGKAAAPVSKIVLQAMIAARDASLDRGTLTASRITPPVAPASANGSMASTALGGSSASTASAPSGDATAVDMELASDTTGQRVPGGSVPFVYRLDQPHRTASVVVGARAIPNVRGLPVRRAVYALHRAGFRVTMGATGNGDAASTAPDAGTVSPSGTTVRLLRAP